MDPMEELVINASSTEESNASVRSNSSFIWPFSSIMGEGNRRPETTRNSSPKKDSKRKFLGRKSKAPSQPAVHHSDENITVDRFQHDLEQAERMRRGMDKRKQERKHQQRIETKLRNAMNGLDEAVVLKRMGRRKEALNISELSIELLIQYLKMDPETLSVPGLSREIVGQRIQSALTLAEETKLEMKKIEDEKRKKVEKEKAEAKAASNREREQRLRNLQQQQSAVNSLSKKLDEAIAKADRLSSRQAATNSVNNPKPNRSANRPKSTTRSPTLPDSDNELIKTVKSDLYIDASKLHNTTWNDIAGLKDAKQALQESAILPLMRPDLFSGLRRPRNILLYGPPGTGKTLLVKAVAHESSCVLFVCTASAMTSKWHGEGEKLLRALFQVARAATPSIIFVDEVDSLLSSRKSEGEHEASRRFKTEFMTNMDGIVKNGGDDNGKHLLVIAATNCPWDIDSAVLRRFPRRIYVPLPDAVTRKALLKNLLEKAGDTDLSNTDIKAVVKRLDGFSGSDITSIASEASFGPIRSLGGIDEIQAAKSSDIRPIQKQDFDKAIDQATKSVSISLLKQYDQWKEMQAAS